VIQPQTNSTVSATILQQSSRASFLGLPVTDWIMAISSAIMVAVTIALAYYARVTIEEGKKARSLDYSEKQLVNLFNPMAHVLGKAEPYTEPFIVRDASGKSYTGSYQKLSETDVKHLQEIFIKFGHYLGVGGLGSYYEVVRSFLFFRMVVGGYLIFPFDQRTAEICELDKHANWAECFANIDLRRKQLISKCISLTGDQ
jgi:hypothetical protein